MDSQLIASVCHEANRQYCAMLGDFSQLPWSEAPQWQRESALTGVLEIRAGRITRPEQAHESWLADKYATGWKYGAIKDAVNKEHPCCVPYSALSVEQQRKDALFFAIVIALI